jgi:hypothetical protein
VTTVMNAADGKTAETRGAQMSLELARFAQ